MGENAHDKIEVIRPALAEVVKYYLSQMPERRHRLTLSLSGCSIAGVPLGDWKFTVEPDPERDRQP